MSRFLLLIATVALWVGLLWFVMRVDFSRQSLLSVAAVHALPPLLLWGGWLFWRRHVRLAKTRAEASEKTQQEADQHAQREMASQAFQEKLQYRRYALDCRWASIVSDSLADSPAANALASSAIVQPEVAHKGQPSAVLAAALSQLAAVCPGAQYLPVYVAESPGLDLAQAVVALRAMRGAQSRASTVSALTGEGGVAATMLARFEREPDLPGALFIAANGPAASDEQDGEEFPLTQPKHVDALVVMLFTHPDLNAAHAKLTMALGAAFAAYHPMTPFWDRKQPLQAGLVERLSQLPEGAAAALAALPVMAQLRRPVEVAGEKPDRAWRSALEAALINANLKPLDFVWDVATPTPEKPADDAAEREIHCAWAVHNAGSFETAGDRLALLGKALDAQDIDLNIIRQGSNVVAEVNLGMLDQWVSLALAIAQAQALAAPTLWAHFGTRSTLGMITPPPNQSASGNA